MFHAITKYFVIDKYLVLPTLHMQILTWLFSFLKNFKAKFQSPISTTVSKLLLLTVQRLPGILPGWQATAALEELTVWLHQRQLFKTSSIL